MKTTHPQAARKSHKDLHTHVRGLRIASLTMRDAESISKAARGIGITHRGQTSGSLQTSRQKGGAKSTGDGVFQALRTPTSKSQDKCDFQIQKNWKNPSAADLHCYVGERPPFRQRASDASRKCGPTQRDGKHWK